MAFNHIKNVRIAGISACVPKNVVSNLSLKISEEYTPQQFVEQTGILERRLGDCTTGDLCIPAAKRLLEDLRWDKNDIDAVIMVTQMGDYILPATACVVQGKLGLSKECLAFDINMGCSGWVCGIHAACCMLAGGTIRKALMMCGDGKRRADYDDPLFGYAGTVTALEYVEGDKGMMFHLGTDGSNFEAIIIPDGGARNQFTEKSLVLHEFNGKMILPIQSHMKGLDVFGFGFSTAPKSVKKLGEHYGFNYLDADYFVFHQANMQMNKMITKKLKLPDEKVPSCMYYFGNTSSASIPLTIVTQLKGKVEDRLTKFICCGFGVGLSWGTVAFETNNLVVSELVEIEDNNSIV